MTRATANSDFIEVQCEPQAIEDAFKLIIIARGELDGVCVQWGAEIDLRHPDLPPEVWAPVGLFGIAATESHSNGPPWLLLPMADPTDPHFAPTKLAALRLRPGDKVEIVDVRPHDINSPLHHPADQEARVATIVIRAAHGATSTVEWPVIFFQRLSIGSRGYGRPEFFSLLESRLASISPKPGGPQAADPGSTDYAANASAAAASSEKLQGERQRFHEYFKGDRYAQFLIDRLIDEAVAFGYYGAAAERDRFMAAPAEGFRRELDRLSNSRRPAINARRAAGRAVMEAALVHVRHNPRTTQADCARAVAAATGRTEGHVTEVIKHMFEPTGRSDGSKRVRAQFLNRD